MRVDVLEKLPKQEAGIAAGTGDAPAGLAAKNFVAAMDSDDSLFALLEPLVASAANDASSGRIFSGDVVLGFKQDEHARQRQLQFLLVERLIELLKEAGSKDTLEAQLCLAAKAAESSGEKENALYVRLAAKGESVEQAAMRWGLGLAHLQQALLFTSRHLRQHLTHSGE